MKNRVKWFIVEVHPADVGADAVAKMLADLAGCGFVVRDQERSSVRALENTSIK